MTDLTGPLKTIAEHYPWARKPLEELVLIFGERRVAEVATRYERSGSFQHYDNYAAEAITSLLSSEILSPPTPRRSIFEPRPAPEATTKARSGR